MNIARFLLRSIVFFIGGMASFFLLLVGLAGILCLLLVGLMCAVFTLWAMIHYGIYLAGYDHQAGHRALVSILLAAGCFGFIVFTSATITDFWRSVRQPRLSLELNR